MAYTTNLKLLEVVLSDLGVDIKAATEIVQSGGDGFTVSFVNVDGKKLPSLQGKIRTALYSWLHCLGIKHRYTVRTLHSGVQVARKATIEAEFYPGVTVGFTKTTRGVTAVLAEAKQEVNVTAVMPDAESHLEEEGIMAMLDEENLLPRE